MRFYDGVVATVVGLVATGLAGCGGGTETPAPAPSPPAQAPSPPAPSPPTPFTPPVVPTPNMSGYVPEVPDVTCDDTSLNQTLARNLTCTATMNETDGACCAAVAGWGGNIDVLVSCEGENAATYQEKEQVYRARCMCAGGGQWEQQLKELSSVNMTACEHPFHPAPGLPPVNLPDPACACGVLEEAKTALTETAGDYCEYYVDGAIDTFGWGSLRAACDAAPSSDLSVESDVERETSPRVDADAKFPWALVAAAGVAGLSVMVVFRMRSRATTQSPDVAELGASC